MGMGNHNMAGVTRFTVMLTVAVAVVYAVVFEGVNVADNVWVPAVNIVPAVGLYVQTFRLHWQWHPVAPQTAVFHK